MIRTCLLIYLVICGVCLFAQDIERKESIDGVAGEYLSTAGSQSVLYYGYQPEGHPRAKTHPYLKDEQFSKARLSYNSIVYPEVLLRLDWSRNELIILSPDSHHLILFPENVDYAELHDLRVVYFSSDGLPGCPASGYYVMLHSGKCKVMEKQTALLKVEGPPTKYNYIRSKFFYLFKDGVYYRIRSKRGLLKHLYPYKKELKQFISANKLRFRGNTEEFLTRTVREYEELGIRN